MTRSLTRALTSSLVSLACLSIVVATPGLAADWPQLRGPHGTCVADAQNLPAELGPDKNVKWKVELPGHSAATPAVWGDSIFVMSPVGGDIDILCFDTSGHERWRKKLGEGNHKLGFNGKNNYATPSPATDGRHVWALVGSGDLACLDFAGNIVWQKNLFEEFGPYETGFGVGFSPLLYNDALYIPLLHQGESMVVALDKKTGNLKWKTPRQTEAEEESKDAYSTPCVIEYPDHAEIVVCGADLATAYDAQTGQEIWRHGDINPTRNKTLRIVVSPTADRQRVYLSSAKRGPVHAVRAGGRGDLTTTEHHLWTSTQDTPDVPTPAIDDGLVYMLRENGILSVLDAETGKPYWHKRISGGSGPFSPSPLVADGKVYMASEGGQVCVVAAGREFKKLAENELGELIMATPVAVGDRLYVRTDKHLYCFSQK